MYIRKFILAGILNTIFGYSVFAILHFLWFGVDSSILIATVIGVLFNYITSSQYVFKQITGGFFKFIFVYLVVYFCTIYSVGFLDGFVKNYYLSYFIIIPFSAIFTYFLQKNYVFSDEKS